MKPGYRELTPSKAWAPLPKSDWTPENASHFLRRTGYAATPGAIDRALADGLTRSIERAFGRPSQMELPYKTKTLEQKIRAERPRLRDAPQSERREFRQKLREEQNVAVRDYAIKWMQHARAEENSASEKWVQFLQDVFVVGIPKVRHPYLLFKHQAMLRDSATGNFGDLCEKVSRSPAMILYLDLQQNVRGDPNENFARELFELFMLGEGNYTESDIREAARAFTGYKTNGSAFRFVSRQHDFGRKTVFGETGAFSGDEIIEAALKQPAARTFLPSELLNYYLSNDVDLDPALMKRLGEIWRGSGFNLGELIRTVFGSRLFYQTEFRGNRIKSPVEFYLGLLQDLDLDVAPFPRIVIAGLRNMGQSFYAPPNVRGWVGGRRWINASTLAARHQLVDWILQPTDEENLNADEYAELMVARLEGRGNLKLTREHWNAISGSDSFEKAVTNLATRFLAAPVSEQFLDSLIGYYQAGSGNSQARAREVVATLLQSPQYQLC